MVTALATGSLALLSDAGHMLTDVARARAWPWPPSTSPTAARRAAQRTFGLYRLEILAALANAVLLFGVAVYVLVEAVRRLGDPPDVLSRRRCSWSPSLGLAANLVAFALLRAGAEESLNVEGAYLEVLADLVGSVGVIVGAIVMAGHRLGLGRPGRRRRHRRVHPAPHLAARARGACASWSRRRPPGIDLDALEADLAARRRASSTCTTCTCGRSPPTWRWPRPTSWCAGGHRRPRACSTRPASLLRERYGIGHATLQVEPDDHEGCDEISW